MATMAEYIEIAQEVYARRSAGPPALLDWETQRWEWGTWYGDGFQGGIFSNHIEMIVGFSGTKGGLTTAPISQNTANARIGVNVIPNLAGSAQSMVNWAKAHAHGRAISLVGHSLGGGLAQVVGNWSGCPFISFNGPGMASHLKTAAFNIFKPMQMVRSIASRATGDTVGICVTVKGDFVGEFGYHVGHEIIVDGTAGGALHSMDAVWMGLRKRNMLQKTPREILSIWPAPPVIGRARS
jgi:putative lipase involved disintegration of autophagic bodies